MNQTFPAPTRRSAILAGVALGATAVGLRASAQTPVPPGVEKLDPALDALIDAAAPVEKLATGFVFADGTCWRKGALWFSDISANKLWRMTPDGKAAVVLEKGGFDGEVVPGSYFGPNGMASAPDGTLTLCQQGNRRLVSLSVDNKVTVLVDHYEGKRLNSPNDVVYMPDGSFYFVDPPYGLFKHDDDPAKELKFNGVFHFAKGKLQLVVQDIPTPHGIAFAPGYKTLYLTNGGNWMRYDVGADGGLTNGRHFADAAPAKGGGLGMKVDALGNLWATGPGGILIFSPEGKHLGTVHVPEPPGNVSFGDDGKTLYIAARTSIYKIRTKVAGLKPPFG